MIGYTMPSRHISFLIAVLVAVLFAGVTPARATTDDGVRTWGPSPFPDADPPAHQLIVRFVPHLEFNFAAQGVAHVRAGTTRVRGLWGMPGYDLVSVPKGSSAEQAMRRYLADPSVSYVEPDHAVRAWVLPDDPLFGQQWALRNTGQSGGTPGADIGAADAWTVTTGGPDVLVAVVDTGVDYEHPDLAPNMWSKLGWNFAERNSDPMDNHGHGTHVAGTVAAAGNDSYGVAGVAWEAQIMALKALGDDGRGWTSDIIDAVNYASYYGADIINMSLGGGSYSQAFYDAIEASEALIVAAAGNNGRDNDSSPSYPASYDLDNIIAVAATDRDDALASWSNYGAESVDLGAPGVAILSTVPGHTYEATTAFADPFDTLDAWSTNSYWYHPWTLSSTRYVSPPHSAGHAPSGGYVANEQSWIFTTDYVSLLDADRIAVRFMARLDTVSSDDWLVLAAKPEGALGWTALAIIAGPTGEFRSYGLETTAMAGTRAQFAFVFVSGDAGGGAGVWVDDVEIDSLVRDSDSDYSDAHGYMSGTSMAAPHVAGVAALLKAYAPGLDAIGLKGAILDTVAPLPGLDGTTLTGGRLDAGAAVASVKPPKSAPVARDDSYTAEAGFELTVVAPGVLANDTDADGDELVAEPITHPAEGKLSLHADGSFAYMPPHGFIGQETFTYQAYDGVEYSDPATVTITVADTIDPMSVAVLDPSPADGAQGWFVSVPAISIEATDTGSGVDHVEWRFGDDEWVKDPVVTGVVDGKHVLLYRSIDIAGNVEEARRIELAVDTSPPVTMSDVAEEVYAAPTTISLVATDTVSGVAATYYSLDGSEATTYTTPIDIAEPGEYTLSFRSIDVAGNTEETQTVGFTLLPPVIEIAGATRFDTAVEASREAFPDGADVVIIATGTDWPDALGGSALAGVLDGPVLLVQHDSVPASVRAEIERLGASRAVIVGGKAAVGTAVSDAFGAAGLDVERIAGASRYETADEVASYVIEAIGESFDGTALVATGADFPDALAAAPLAVANGWPLYLAHPQHGLLPATRVAMEDIDRAIILGGTEVVDSSTQTALETTYGEMNVVRLAGATRYETAVEVAEYGVGSAGLGWNRVGITTGELFPDALAGGALQGRARSVMLLTGTDSLPAETRAALTANKESISTVTYFGGDRAVSQDVRRAVARALH